MAEKQINGRIVHKHDTEANWVKATNFIPKQGELIVYDVDSTHTSERFKIGDGATLVSNLPFANTTYSAGSGLSLSGTTLNHSNSVTAGTAQGDASKTLTFGGTFTVPTITYDA